MKIMINTDLLKIIGKQDGRVEYLINWILGYIIKNESIKVSKVINLYNFKGKSSIPIDIPESLFKKIKMHIDRKVDINYAANWFLSIAILWGQGE